MYKYIKRFIDTIIAFIFLIILFIPMCVVAICIKLEDGGPVFYKQTRIGKDLKPFKIYLASSSLSIKYKTDAKASTSFKWYGLP